MPPTNPDGTGRGEGTSDSATPASPPTYSTWTPLESDSNLLTKYLLELTGNKYVRFYDLFSLDPQAQDPDFVPMALLLVFPVNESYDQMIKSRMKAVSKDSDRQLKYDGQLDRDALWFRQSNKNSCGTMAILHAVANNPDILANSSDSNAVLVEFLRESKGMNVDQRSEMFQSLGKIKELHQRFARQGSTRVPSEFEDIDLHYICFVSGRESRRIIELDGRQEYGPYCHAELPQNENMLGNTALGAVQTFIANIKGSNSFSLLALGIDANTDSALLTRQHTNFYDKKLHWSTA